MILCCYFSATKYVFIPCTMFLEIQTQVHHPLPQLPSPNHPRNSNTPTLLTVSFPFDKCREIQTLPAPSPPASTPRPQGISWATLASKEGVPC